MELCYFDSCFPTPNPHYIFQIHVVSEFFMLMMQVQGSPHKSETGETRQI